MQKLQIPKRTRRTPAENNDQTAEEYFAEMDQKFNRMIEEMAALLEWKPETVAGFIFQSLNLWYWSGKTPFEIAAQQHYYQTQFAFTSLKLRRETFLSNAGIDD